MKQISIPNWDKFQHYKDRCPPWIKLHNSLLCDYGFHCLPDASKLHLIMLWLLASQMENDIPYDERWIQSKLMLNKPVKLKPLIDNGFVVVKGDLEQDGSEVLAERLPRGEQRRGREEAERTTFGEFNNVKLTMPEHEKLKALYGSSCDNAIEILDSYIEQTGKRYKSHYAVMKKSGWVYGRTMEGPSGSAGSSLDAWKKTRDEVAAKVIECRRLKQDITRCFKACRDKWGDAPKYDGKDPVSAGIDMGMNNRLDD